VRLVDANTRALVLTLSNFAEGQTAYEGYDRVLSLVNGCICRP
jgi:hypothetical protein